MPDRFDTKVNDWEMAFVGGLAAVRYGGGGFYVAWFRSSSAGVLEKFYLVVAGVGLGGNATSFDPHGAPKLSFVRLEVLSPFAVRDLDHSTGILTSASLGAKVRSPGNLWSLGYSSVKAEIRGDTLFKYDGIGISVGSGTGVFSFLGFWYSHHLNGDSVNLMRAVREENERAVLVKDVKSTWERGIQSFDGWPKP